MTSVLVRAEFRRLSSIERIGLLRIFVTRCLDTTFSFVVSSNEAIADLHDCDPFSEVAIISIIAFLFGCQMYQ